MDINLSDAIKQPSPEGWVPKHGEYVIVPAKTSRRAFSAIVTAVLDDIVRVRVPIFRMGQQEWLLANIRTHPNYRRETGM